jgi:hypothetical protein
MPWYYTRSSSLNDLRKCPPTLVPFTIFCAPFPTNSEYKATKCWERVESLSHNHALHPKVRVSHVLMKTVRLYELTLPYRLLWLQFRSSRK